MALQQSYIRTLQAMKQRGRLGGRGVAREETEGISRGYFGAAGERVAARKGLESTERMHTAGITSQETMQERGFGEALRGREWATGERTGSQTFQAGESALGRTQQATLAANQLAAAVKMHADGLISDKDLQKARVDAQASESKLGRTWQTGESGLDRASAEKMAEIQAESVRYQVGQTSGLLGGGGFLGAGMGSGSFSGVGGIGNVLAAPFTAGASLCIIVTSCTRPDSYEVNVTREYRNKVLPEITLGGYYAMCPFIVPLIWKYEWFKKLTKKVLVDRLVDCFEYRLGIKEKRELRTSNIVTNAFLGLCSLIGQHVNRKFWIALHN